MSELPKLCPIGLECLLLDKGHGDCANRSYCSSMAAAWPLPYQIWEIDYFYDKGALVVSIPELTDWDQVPNNEWDIIAADDYDARTRYLRRELHQAGWMNSVELPYYWDEIQKALIITQVCIIEGSRTNPEEGFAPAVKIDNWRASWDSCRCEIRGALKESLPPIERDKWGFYIPNGVPGLAWHWQEQEDED